MEIFPLAPPKVASQRLGEDASVGLVTTISLKFRHAGGTSENGGVDASLPDLRPVGLEVPPPAPHCQESSSIHPEPGSPRTLWTFPVIPENCMNIGITRPLIEHLLRQGTVYYARRPSAREVEFREVEFKAQA